MLDSFIKLADCCAVPVFQSELKIEVLKFKKEKKKKEKKEKSWWNTREVKTKKKSFLFFNILEFFMKV